MRVVYCVPENQMPEWIRICEAFANKVGAKLLFVNDTSCGVQFPDGSFSHMYIEDIQYYLNRYW